MKVLVVGSGGREHALCWKIAQSPLVQEVLCAPGNAGTAGVARNLPIAASDLRGLVAAAKKEEVGLCVIGPENPLVDGLADELRAAGIEVFGPGKDAARLEGSKSYCKEVLERHRLPTAQSRRFDRSGAAKSFIETCQVWPQVIKADGLAAGKGVVIAQDAAEASAAIDSMMEKRAFGAAGDAILIEEFLEGEETSVHAITDGETILILEPVMDHKQLEDGDRGPNTGGMGVYSPIEGLPKRALRQVEQRVLVPLVHGLRREGHAFRGVLFVGLMITESGPKVLEINVRFGDPETQALMRRFDQDLVPYLVATAQGKLSKLEAPAWSPKTVVGVVGAAEGYPSSGRKGDPIQGLEEAGQLENVVVFHAGTEVLKGQVVTAGGRVLCVTSLGEDLPDARESAYGAFDRIHWDGKQGRRDIGAREDYR